ncbi:predicted protein [Chaetoceros tenuissimus]|uniref:F-box domain-containing protein n=1 Tax=Chaetoceros tenuissimus TaxID=426638 RepID=A0AAD3H6V5_9STRA|nr:predicted protein [Chaetoceros tenuissimus]
MMSTPQSKKQKTGHFDTEDLGTSINDLPSEVLVHTFSFIKDGWYRYIALTSWDFYETYREEHTSRTSIKNVVTSKACIRLFLDSSYIVYEKAIYKYLSGL